MKWTFRLACRSFGFVCLSRCLFMQQDHISTAIFTNS